MARSKSAASYAEELWTMVRGAALEGKIYEIPVDNGDGQGFRKALRWQGRFYAFRGALMRDCDKLALRDPATYSQLDVKTLELYPLSMQVVCYFDRREENITKVSLMHKRLTPDSMAMAQAIINSRQALPGALESEDMNASLARVMEKLGPPQVDPYAKPQEKE